MTNPFFAPTPQPISMTALPITLFEAPIYAGFPSSISNTEQRTVDLNTYLVRNENTTFLYTVRGQSMRDIGIYDGDTLIVDRSITPEHNHIVLAAIDEEFTVKRLYKNGQIIKLVAENPNFPAIECKDGQELRIWGVATFNLHHLRHV